MPKASWCMVPARAQSYFGFCDILYAQWCDVLTIVDGFGEAGALRDILDLMDFIEMVDMADAPRVRLVKTAVWFSRCSPKNEKVAK